MAGPDQHVQAARGVTYLDFLRVLPPAFLSHSRLRTLPAYRPSARISRLTRGGGRDLWGCGRRNPAVPLHTRRRRFRIGGGGEGRAESLADRLRETSGPLLARGRNDSPLGRSESLWLALRKTTRFHPTHAWPKMAIADWHRPTRVGSAANRRPSSGTHRPFVRISGGVFKKPAGHLPADR